MLKIKRLARSLGLILLSQSDLISLHKNAMQRFHMNVAVQFIPRNFEIIQEINL